MAKYTIGGEFKNKRTGKPYIGVYCIGPDKKYYTGDKFIFNVSDILEKIVQYTKENKSIIDYDSLNSIYYNYKWSDADYYYPSITEDNLKDGYIIRYFAKQKSIKFSKIIEINKKTFKKLDKHPFYDKIKIDWAITNNYNNFNNKYNLDQTIIEEGIISLNLKEIKLKDLEFNGLKNYLLDPVELSIISSTDISTFHTTKYNIFRKYYFIYNKLGYQPVPLKNYIDKHLLLKNNVNRYNLIHTKYPFSDFNLNGNIGLKTGVKIKNTDYYFMVIKIEVDNKKIKNNLDNESIMNKLIRFYDYKYYKPFKEKSTIIYQIEKNQISNKSIGYIFFKTKKLPIWESKKFLFYNNIGKITILGRGTYFPIFPTTFSNYQIKYLLSSMKEDLLNEKNLLELKINGLIDFTKNISSNKFDYNFIDSITDIDYFYNNKKSIKYTKVVEDINYIDKTSWWNEIYKLQDNVLNIIFKFPTKFYLTGGSCLNRFYYHKRHSLDLDFFINSSDQFHSLVDSLLKKFLEKKLIYEIEVNQKNFVRLWVKNDLQIDFVNYRMLNYVGKVQTKKNINIDNIFNILAMKVHAIINKDSRPQDIFDIYLIAKYNNFNWKDIIEYVKERINIKTEILVEKLINFPRETIYQLDLIDKDFLNNFNSEFDLLIDDITNNRENSLFSISKN